MRGAIAPVTARPFTEDFMSMLHAFGLRRVLSAMFVPAMTAAAALTTSAAQVSHDGNGDGSPHES